jgi:hypothetical protein
MKFVSDATKKKRICFLHFHITKKDGITNDKPTSNEMEATPIATADAQGILEGILEGINALPATANSGSLVILTDSGRSQFGRSRSPIPWTQVST